MSSSSYWITLVLLVLCAASASAEGVYKWQDENGVITYSNEKPFEGAKPVELPPIMRADVPTPKVELESCEQHGGIDCSAGPDSDGSVICHDAFTGAAALYRFNCHSAKLNINEISDLNEAGYFSVFVRNQKSVKAEMVSLHLTISAEQELKLEGPTEIEAYGVAEYKLQQDYEQGPLDKPRLEQLRLECANCPA